MRTAFIGEENMRELGVCHYPLGNTASSLVRSSRSSTLPLIWTKIRQIRRISRIFGPGLCWIRHASCRDGMVSNRSTNSTTMQSRPTRSTSRPFPVIMVFCSALYHPVPLITAHKASITAPIAFTLRADDILRI